jgi:hypothetical protein
MTRTSTARIEVRRWKAHTCVGCGCRYAYLMVRKLAYGGSTPERATEKAHAAAERVLAQEVDRQPCPTCGLYQPDMVARGRRLLHTWMLVVSPLALVLIAGLYLGDAIQSYSALAAAAGLVATVGAVGTVVDFRNPNRHLEANRRVAEQEIAAQRMRLLQPAATPLPSSGPTSPRFHSLLALGLAAAALLAVALPERMRQRAGWTLNPNWYPPVAGPGDETCLYLPESITSLKGYWNGRSKVTAHMMGDHAAGDGAPHEFEIASSTRQTDWGHLIQARANERSSRARLWVRIRLPADEEFAHKSLVCTVALAVQYPVFQDAGLTPSVSRFQQEATLKLASPSAAHAYRTWWWGGFAGGTTLLLASILLRLRGAQALRKTANQAEVLDMTEP